MFMARLGQRIFDFSEIIEELNEKIASEEDEVIVTEETEKEEKQGRSNMIGLFEQCPIILLL